MNDLKNAADSNDRLETLVALRSKIAETIESTDSGRDIAALSKRLMEIMNEIDELRRTQKTAETPLSRRKAKHAHG